MEEEEGEIGKAQPKGLSDHALTLRPGHMGHVERQQNSQTPGPGLVETVR